MVNETNPKSFFLRYLFQYSWWCWRGGQNSCKKLRQNGGPFVEKVINFETLAFFTECDSQCSEVPSPMEVVQPHVLAIGSLVPVQKSSPERRNQKEIVAGEERPKFLTVKQTEDAQGRWSSIIKETSIYSYLLNTLEEFSEFRHFFASLNPPSVWFRSPCCVSHTTITPPAALRIMYEKYTNHATCLHIFTCKSYSSRLLNSLKCFYFASFFHSFYLTAKILVSLVLTWGWIYANFEIMKLNFRDWRGHTKASLSHLKWH